MGTTRPLSPFLNRTTGIAGMITPKSATTEPDGRVVTFAGRMGADDLRRRPRRGVEAGPVPAQRLGPSVDELHPVAAVAVAPRRGLPRPSGDAPGAVGDDDVAGGGRGGGGHGGGG